MSQDDRSSNAGFFLAGAVVGGAVGAVLALLFAPQSGEETRKMIKEKASDVQEDIVEMKKELEPKLQKAKDDLAKKFSK
jgi:gas vesicle protein